MGKASRRKRERKAAESPESRAFRELMDQDEADVRFNTTVERHAEAYPDEPDFEALAACAHCLGVVNINAAPVFVVEPIGDCDDHMEFDRTVCKAGLRRFIRRPMTSDYPGHGTPLDPSIPVPDVDLGEWLLVIEATAGMRMKRSIRIGWLTEPVESL